MKILATVVTLMVALMADTGIMVECATEDSDMCVWHADRHGDGKGRSFISIFDHQIYLD